MSRESVPCVTRTFMCDSLRRSSSWLEIGSLETNFRICPCRNLLCTFNAMVDLTLCTHLHNYARGFGPLSILFLTLFETWVAQALACGVGICKDKNPQAEACATEATPAQKRYRNY